MPGFTDTMTFLYDMFTQSFNTPARPTPQPPCVRIEYKPGTKYHPGQNELVCSCCGGGRKQDSNSCTIS